MFKEGLAACPTSLMYDLYIAWLQECLSSQDTASESDPELQRGIQQEILDLCAQAHAKGTVCRVACEGCSMLLA